MNVGLDDRTLRRIIALLVSFAALAESAASRSLPVRWLVLAILRYAERVVVDHVADALQVDADMLRLDSGGQVDEPSLGHEPYDAAFLAWRLRALASLLGTLLAPARHPDDWTLDVDGWTAIPDTTLLTLAPFAVGLFAMPDGCQPAFHDTSRPARSPARTPCRIGRAGRKTTVARGAGAWKYGKYGDSLPISDA